LPFCLLSGVIGGAPLGGDVSASMRTLSKWLVAAVLVGGAAIFLNDYAGRTKVPRQIKLAECTNAVLSIHFLRPKGNHFNLVLATPSVGDEPMGGPNRPPFTFSGHIRVLAPSSADLPISSEQCERCNWLQSRGIPVGYILTWNLRTNYPRFDQLLSAGGEAHLEVGFEQPPPTNTSLWLTWLQPWKDRDK
jgi:hypothetical protein